jgi:hypothetical protein
MSKVVDNLIAFKLLYMLVTPFKETQAYKLGIIDEKGNNLKKVNALKTSAEKDAYTYLHRLVFNVKKILNRLPGGENKMKSIVAAFWLVRESYELRLNPTKLEENYKSILQKINLENIVFVEEELLLKEILEELGNVTGAGVATNEPVIRVNKLGKRYGSFKVGNDVIKRFQKKKKAVDIGECLDFDNQESMKIYEFVEKNPNAILVLRSEDSIKTIKFDSSLQVTKVEEF